MKKYLKFADLAVAALCVIALIMLFLPATGNKDADLTYSGFNLVFGYSEKTEILGKEVVTEIFKFSFVNLLTVLFVLGALALSVLNYVKANKLFGLVSVALSLLAGVFFLLIMNFAVCEGKEFFLEHFSLGAGAIIAAVCMFLATGAGAAKVVLDK